MLILKRSSRTAIDNFPFYFSIRIIFFYLKKKWNNWLKSIVMISLIVLKISFCSFIDSSNVIDFDRRILSIPINCLLKKWIIWSVAIGILLWKIFDRFFAWHCAQWSIRWFLERKKIQWNSKIKKSKRQTLSSCVERSILLRFEPGCESKSSNWDL